MNKIDRKFMFVLLSFVIVIGLIAITVSVCVNSKSKVTFSNGTSESSQVTKDTYIFPADLNTVTKDQLMQIDGIGEKTAQKIIDYRTKTGGYKNIEQLLNVDSIGDKTLEKLKKYLYVLNSTDRSSSIPDTDSKSSKPTKPTKPTKSTKSTTEKNIVNYPLDINFATYDELVTLPGIGEDKAKNIINHRQTKGYFYSIEEIMLVDGIGQKTFDEIKSKIIVDVKKLPPKQQTTTITSTTTAPVVTTVVTPLSSVNVNTATFEELMKIPGIKDYTAKAIIYHRNHDDCRFMKLEEVEAVLSVQKPNQFQTIKKYITV